MKRETYPNYDWAKIPTGSTFTAKINGQKVSGRIYKKDEEVWLCQNKKDGNIALDLLGYKHSWFIETGSPSSLNDNFVTNLRVYLDPVFSENYQPITLPIKHIGDYRINNITTKGFYVGGTYVSKEDILKIAEVYAKL